ncbi:MAG: hypothetical protein JOZ32_00655 [Bryobacterales bacterium]|nr:hypothetical protein [Bryobacterales bacterium]
MNCKPLLRVFEAPVAKWARHAGTVVSTMLLCVTIGQATSLPIGTYIFQDSSGNTWEGGASRLIPNDPHMYLYSYNDGPDQQFIWNGSTLQESYTRAYVLNSSSTLELGNSGGTFAIVSSGSGYTIQDTASGLYVNSPGAQYPSTMSLSSTPTVWTATPAGAPLPSGTYTFQDSSGHTWDGGFNRSIPSDLHMYLYSYNDGPDQQFIWNGSTLQESYTLAYVLNSSSVLELGSSGGTFAIVSSGSGSGYFIQDVASGLYVTSPNAPYPTAISLSSTPTVWTATLMEGGPGLRSGTPTTTINDNDPSIVYSLSSTSGGKPAACSTTTTNWCYFTGLPGNYSSDEHYSDFVRSSGSGFHGASMALTFYGTGITWIGQKGPNNGQSSWSIDGGTPTTFDGYNASVDVYQTSNATVTGLSSGYHVLYIGALAQTSGGYYGQTIDGFQITGSPVSLSSGTVIGCQQPGCSLRAITHGTGWQCGAASGDISGGHCYSRTANDYLSWSFTGSLIEVYGRPDAENGYMDVSIDGGTATRVDSNLGSIDDDAVNGTLLYAKNLSSSGPHTITISVVGSNDGYSCSIPGGRACDDYVQIDELVSF